MKKLSDVNVVLNIEKPAVPINLGTLAIFTPSDKDGIETYSTIDEIDEKLTDEKLNSAAHAYFNQDGHSDNLIIVRYSDLSKALDAYFYADWEFATLLDSTSTVTPPDAKTAKLGDNDLLMFSNYVEQEQRKFLVIGLPGTDETATNAKAISDKYLGNERTILFAADDNATANAAVALVGAVGNKTVGSVTWKFKTIAGVEPVEFNASQVEFLHKYHINTYVTKAGIEQTSEGFTNGGNYIDELHGDDWIKVNMEAKLQKMLSTTDKLTYDARGIAQINSIATSVLQDATNQDIILINDKTGAGEFSVSTKSRAESNTTDISNRHYDGLEFSYQRSGAIHTITVHGTVKL